MKREDLRSKIIPTTIGNTDEGQYTGNEEFNTTDKIYLDSYDELYDGKKTNAERRISATDYAQMNNAEVYDVYTTRTRTGRPITCVWLRSAGHRYYVRCVDFAGNDECLNPSNRYCGLCPSLHYHLPSDIEEIKELDIREVKDLERKKYISYTKNL